MEQQLYQNPLLAMGFPSFSEIDPEHFMPAVNAMIAAGDGLLQNIVTEVPDDANWEYIIDPYLSFLMRFERVLSLSAHIDSVFDNKEWRLEYQKSLEPVADFFVRWSHSCDLYHLFNNYRNHPSFTDQMPERQIYIKNYLRDAELEGVNAKQSVKKKLQKNSQMLARASNSFSNNVLDAEEAWYIDGHHVNFLDGMPDPIIEKLIQDVPDDVFARVPLKGEIVQLVLSSANDRELREQVYRAWVSRASDVGPHAGRFDNTKNITELLKLRLEKAQLLGFNSYAEYTLADMNAKSVDGVIKFLEGLGEKAKHYAEQEKERILRFAEEEMNMTDVKPWDLAYITEKMRQKIYELNEEEVREYFVLEAVINKIIMFTESLYDVKFVRNECVDTYLDDILVFDIYNSKHEVAGSIYMDLYSRPGKRGGAWVNDYQSRSRFTSMATKPIVFLVCNFAKGVEDYQTLLSHSEFVTIMHELGHAMHCIMTKVETYGVSGFSGVPWDLIEWPSQWMENWAWTTELMRDFCNYEDYIKKIPKQMIHSIQASKSFNAGLAVTRQVTFALTDILIHAAEEPLTAEQASAVYSSVLERFSVWPEFPEQRFLHAFSHIFAGGYSSAYYSYLWAEALAADSFISLRELHKDNYTTIGKNFCENVLEVGGMLHVDMAFGNMLKRRVEPDMLLKHLGLREY